MDLEAEVAATIRAHRMLADGATVVVAVSGGADSVVLLDLLARLSAEHGWRLHVAAFDHRWRPDSAVEVAAVEAMAAERGLPCSSGAADAPDRTEAGARRQRQGFLRDVAKQVGADAVAVGHTADDRAETLLLNLLRGAGTTGLGAMTPVSGVFIRPLIDSSRAAVRAYAESRGLPFVDDPSNVETRFLRNRVRHDLLPLLERFQTGAAALLARSARVCGAERDALRRYGERLLVERLVEPRAVDFLAGLGALVLDLEGWEDLPVGERWLILRRAILRLRGDLNDIDLARIEELDGLAAGSPTAEPLVVPCGEVAASVSRSGGRVVLLPADASFGPWGPVPLAVPGRTVVEPARLTVVAGSEAGDLALTATLDPDRCGSLAVRSRRAGDRIRPQGRGGSRSVQDLLVDLTVPRVVRERVPVVVDGERVAWVPGAAPDESYAAPPGEGVAVGIDFALPGGAAK